jgi:hypothetical protein
MKKTLLILSSILMYCIVSAQDVDSVAWKNSATESAFQLHKSFTERDFETYAKLNHPKLVEMMGGRDSFANTLDVQLKQIEAELKIDSFAFGEPYHFVKNDTIIHCTLPQTMVMRSLDSTFNIRSRIYLMGISDNNGKTWFFLDTTNGAMFLDMVEPRRIKDYAVPEREQEYFTKEKKD